MEVQTHQQRMEARAISRFTGLRVHFIGIGGCGMSGLARMLLDVGAIVTGSEPKPSDVTFALIQRGVRITRDQLGELLTEDIDLVVRTAAVKDDNAELLLAQRLGIRTLKYAQLLGEVMEERYGIAVSGTHGKSTTTAMIAWALLECGLDPSFVVGGTVPQLGGGSRSGGGGAFVAEACEYDRSFHNLHPTVALIMNIEEDHLDCYYGIDDIVESFNTFARLVPDDGLIIANGNDPQVKRALRGIASRVETVTVGGQSTWSTTAGELRDGCPTGIVHRGRQVVGELALSIPGRHNLFNATMALAACIAAGANASRAIDALNRFTGVDRRVTLKGTCNGATIIDDYGHHPTEIQATLAALRERYNPRKLYCVFQPHQHSRTRFLLEDFAKSFAAADETIVPDIYFVRDSEAERQAVSALDLVDKIRNNGHEAQYLKEFDAIVAYLRPKLVAGDLVVTMGAGNVCEVGEALADD